MVGKGESSTGLAKVVESTMSDSDLSLFYHRERTIGNDELKEEDQDSMYGRNMLQLLSRALQFIEVTTGITIDNEVKTSLVKAEQEYEINALDVMRERATQEPTYDGHLVERVVIREGTLEYRVTDDGVPLKKGKPFKKNGSTKRRHQVLERAWDLGFCQIRKPEWFIKRALRSRCYCSENEKKGTEVYQGIGSGLVVTKKSIVDLGGSVGYEIEGDRKTFFLSVPISRILGYQSGTELLKELGYTTPGPHGNGNGAKQ